MGRFSLSQQSPQLLNHKIGTQVSNAVRRGREVAISLPRDLPRWRSFRRHWHVPNVFNRSAEVFIEGLGARTTAAVCPIVHLATDHLYSSIRIALLTAVIGWFDGLRPR